MTSKHPKEDNQEPLPKMEYRQVLFSPTGVLLGIVVCWGLIFYEDIYANPRWMETLSENMWQNIGFTIMLGGFGNLFGAYTTSSMPFILTDENGTELVEPKRKWHFPFNKNGISFGIAFFLFKILSTDGWASVLSSPADAILWTIGVAITFGILGGIMMPPELPGKN